MYRNKTVLIIGPAILAVALVFALAPACTMPSCNSIMGLAGMIDHACQDYMMVDDTPDGLPTPQAPAVATIAVSLPPVPADVSCLPRVTMEAHSNPEYDPLGVRIRI
ncbi:MAG TPA: hypothetical protein VFH17_04470 [Coriobacteriia bacterium]|nr:hypothetical protein [Coriobacteriia bacterium]